MHWLRCLEKFHKDESGQDLLEYVLVIAAVATAAVAGSGSLTSMMTNAIQQLSGVIGNAINNV